MKRALVVLLSASLLAATPAAFAGNRHGGWHGGHGYGGHGWGGHRYYGHHHNNNNNNDAWAYALGGLVVGGLVSNAYYRSRAPYVSYPSTVVVRETTYPAPVVVSPGRTLLRDLEGRCYERRTDGAGNEMRIELPAENCNW